MKKTIQPIVRKVYGNSQQQQPNQSSVQMNAVRKINNLLQSGAVTVTGPNQTRVLKQKPSISPGTITSSTPVKITTSATSTPTSPSSTPIIKSIPKTCFICDENCTAGQGFNIAETLTTTSQTKLPNKIARLIGGDFMIIIGVGDLICRRCIALVNQLDKLEFDFDRVHGNFVNILNKKYSLFDDEADDSVNSDAASPPAKMQKLNSGSTIQYNNTENKVTTPLTLPRKNAVANNSITKDSADSQTSQFETSSGSISSPNTSITTNNVTATSNVATAATTAPATNTTTTLKRGVVKMYKCISCEFKTADLAQFQPHYETCKQQATTSTSPVSASATSTVTAYRCQLCRKIFSSIALLKQHSAELHPNQAAQIQTLEKLESPVATKTTSTEKTLHSCTSCQYKTYDKQSYDEHVRKHIKLKPFKCRICLARFETREQASVHAKTHQPDYFKCGVCAVTFSKRELLMKHLEVHDKNKAVVTKINTTPSGSNTAATTQKLLQDTINEALRDTNETIDAKTIQFHQCLQCSLTFLNETLYSQHMKMHNSSESVMTTAGSSSLGGASITTTAGSGSGVSSRIQTVSSASAKAGQITNKKTIISVNNTTGTITTTTTTSKASNVTKGGNVKKNALVTGTNSQNSSAISDGDLESIFEKMHSDKADVSSANSGDNKNQDNSSGITFNITIPELNEGNKTKPAVPGIDMPTLDQPDDSQQQQSHEEDSDQQEGRQHQIVNMPNLDDDGDTQNSQSSEQNQVAMDLEELQNAAGGEGIKYILSENGQLLQLDNHILTTDADGNQILVQGTDSEQIQQLLQSVGVVMQGGEGETIQMLGDNNQMIIVQGSDGQEAQLINASMLNSEGNIVIQQSQQGELNAEGTHITTEDGIQIPVSVAFAAAAQQHLDSGAEGPLTVSVSAGEDGQTEQIQLHHIEQNIKSEDKQSDGASQDSQSEEEQPKKDDLSSNEETSEQENTKQSSNDGTAGNEEEQQEQSQSTNESGEVFFNIDEIIQPGNQDK